MDQQAFAQLLGNYGEFLGAIAVVVTLVYLAVQVKYSRESMDANTRAMRGQAVADTMYGGIAYLNMVTQGQDVADAYVRFTNDDELDPNTRMVAHAMVSAMFVARQHEYFQWKQGLLDAAIFEGFYHMALRVLASKNGRLWWETSGSNWCSSEFVEHIENLRRTVDIDDLEGWKRAFNLRFDDADQT